MTNKEVHPIWRSGLTCSAMDLAGGDGSGSPVPNGFSATIYGLLIVKFSSMEMGVCRGLRFGGAVYYLQYFFNKMLSNVMMTAFRDVSE